MFRASGNVDYGCPLGPVERFFWLRKDTEFSKCRFNKTVGNIMNSFIALTYYSHEVLYFAIYSLWPV
jgi:hypothetical protein